MFRLYRSFFAGFFLLFISGVQGQTIVSGSVNDKTGPLPGASVKALSMDSVFVTGAATDLDGNFSFSLTPGKRYILVISFLGFRRQTKDIEVSEIPLVLPVISLSEDSKNLSEVEVKTTQTRGEQKGDTTQFNANAYKTNPDANAEDLIKKMPGITSDNTGVKVNGENVQKVLVDGKPFFGDDPNAALKNLPAEIIDKVEVFDRMSDQSQFTGFSDGDDQKTINIITKKGRNEGQFGRIFAGYGADEGLNPRYQAGAAINTFKEKQKITLLLLSNNINQQNFSATDISGNASSSSQGGGRGGGRSGGSPLLTAPQNGITTTQSAGLNYSDVWGQKLNVSGSYFFNKTQNINSSNIVRNYFTENKLVYNQVNTDRNNNLNHRANLRLEYTIDSSNKITIIPAINFQDNGTNSTLYGTNSILDNIILSETNTSSKNKNTGYDLSNTILYQHKFKKQGRTISFNINTQLNERNNNGSYLSANIYNDTIEPGLDQVYNTYSYNKKAGVNVSYTEPLNKSSQLQVNYNPSYTIGKSDKSTKDHNSVTNDYDEFNSALSNKYDNIYETQRGGLSYRYNKGDLNYSIGTDVQEARLNGKQTFPFPFTINQTFRNILPNARLNYKFSRSKNLRINYRSSTNIPSLTQLQNVIDISNPLQVRSGNPSLKQTFENNLSIRYGGFNKETARNIMFFLNAGYADNYITNAVYVLRKDSIVQGFDIKAGSQLTQPVNLNGYYNTRAFFVYGLPVSALKSNVNFNTGINYNHTPSLINNRENISNTYAFTGGVFIGSNISGELDFSVGYNGNYTIVKNSLQKQSDNNFFTHATTFKCNWIFLKGFVLNSDISHTLYNGLSRSFNQDYFLWNGYIGYKFLKDRSLEAKVAVFDILNQNRSISRTVTGAYTEDSYTTVLRRYAILTLTYTLRNFKNGTPPKQEEDSPFQGPGQRQRE